MEKEQIIPTEGLKMGICRFCLSEDVKLAHIYSASKKLGTTIAEAAMECTNVQISLNDGLPLYVCKNCYLKLHDVQQFKKMVLKSDAVLRTYHRQLCFDENTLRINYPTMDEPLDFDETRCTDQSSDDEKIMTEDPEFDLGNDVVEETVVKSEISNEESQIKTVICSNGQKFRVHIDIDNINESFEKQVVILIPNNEKVLTDSFNSRNNLTSNEQTTSNASEKFLEKSDNLLCNNSVENMFEANTRKDLEKSGNSLKNHVSDSAVGSSVADDTDDWHSEEVTSKGDNSEMECEKDENTFLKCKMSNRSYIAKDTLRRHILTIHENTRFQCEICEKSYSRKDKLREHEKKMHGSVDRFRNENKSTSNKQEISKKSRHSLKNIVSDNAVERDVTNSSVADDIDDYRSEEVVSKDDNPEKESDKDENTFFKCKICKRSYTRKNNLRRHILNKHGSDNEKPHFQCEICEKIYAHKTNIRSHMRRIHESNDSNKYKTKGGMYYNCSICNEKFKQYSDYYSHKVRHFDKNYQPGKPFQCNVCGKYFKKLFDLKRHSRRHDDDDRPFQCTKCDKKCKTKYDLASHQRIHDDTTEFHSLCPICGKAIKYNMMQHILRHSEKKSQMCQECGKTFKDLSHLTRHKEIHDGKIIECTICNKSFKGKHSFSQHNRNIHHEKEFKCKICFKISSSQKTLTAHIKGVHEKKRTFDCSECKKTFSTYTGLKLHKQSSHGVKSFECEECGKCFSRKDFLVMHLRMHSGEKPYKCDDCNKRFSRNDNLKTHKKKVHNISMKYKCKVCDKKFKKKCKLDNHIEDNHNVPM